MRCVGCRAPCAEDAGWIEIRRRWRGRWIRERAAVCPRCEASTCTRVWGALSPTHVEVHDDA